MGRLPRLFKRMRPRWQDRDEVLEEKQKSV